jgi:Fe-S-cluster-containing hydrogenase component 2
MSENISTRGCASIEEIKCSCGYPSEKRFMKGPVAVIECIQEIPCNPCEAACNLNAISVGDPITNLPKLDEKKCIGCGRCLTKCPGLAIFIVDKTYAWGLATVSFPHEYYPLPQKGKKIQAVNRKGQAVCEGEVIRVNTAKSNEGTSVVTIAVPIEYSDEVRGMKRLQEV